MATRTVVTRTRQVEPAGPQTFTFTREMIPALSGMAGIPEFLSDYLIRAWEAYERLPMPTTTDEPWRRTDLRGLEVGSFRLATSTVGKETIPLVPSELLQPLAGEQHGGQVLLLPGGVQAKLAPELTSQGVIFTDLVTAERQYPDILAHIIGQVVRPDEGKFAAMAAALAHTGVLVYIPQGVHIEQPLHSLLWGPGVGLAYFSHILVWVDDNASLTFVHETASPHGQVFTGEGANQTLHAGIVEIHVGAGSNLRFVELQSWGDQVWNFTHERIRVERDANLDWIFGAIGSHLTKNFSTLDLIGEGATGRMSGFYFADGDQHLDHDTQQNHLAPHTTSDLLFKGAVTDRSRSVWQGMIYVAPGAEKTDGYQANRNLVLSPKARADSIPGLEILADDVRCTHGATVGKIDVEQIFYLLSRGIPYSDAVHLIVEGFFDPIMQRIPFEGVRARFQQAIVEKME
jgi:Fe-S cluster assembly protein SufD